MTMANSGKIRLTLIRSKFGRLKNHRACIDGLGLRRMHHSVVVDDTPAIRGMINQVAYLLRIEERVEERVEESAR